MAVVNKEFRFVFLCEPHTGSRAVREALLTIPGSVETNGEHHASLSRCTRLGFLTGREACSYTVFATIRNPADLLATCWFVYGRKGTFENFVRHEGISFQQDDTLFWRTVNDVDILIRYEALELGLNTVLTECGYSGTLQLPTVGITVGKPHWTELWFPGLAEFAHDNYGDITRYGYRTIFDGLDAVGAEPNDYVTVTP